LQRIGLAGAPTAIGRGKLGDQGITRVWLHALSVGEVISAVPLVKGLNKAWDHHDIFFSVSTKTGFEVANELVKEKVKQIFFFPYDLLISVKHIIGKIDPALVVVVETDIWPNFLIEMKKRNIPVILVNARLSQTSFRGYKKFSFFTKPLFSTFSEVCAQSMIDAERFRHLSIPLNKITITGNVKFDQTYDPITKEEIERLRQWMNIQPGQKIFVAGSTHKGEELILSNAFSKIKKSFEDYLLIIAPRNMERTGSVYRIFKAAGFSVVRLKEINKGAPSKGFEVIVIDEIGLLRRLYAFAEITFVGGSLAPFGGHNPLEPAAFSKPILFGPDMSDFEDISEKLLASEGAIRVKDVQSLYQATEMLISDRKKAQEMGANAYQVYNTNQGAAKRTLNVLAEYISIKR
jgi:3-deoxy-D-manno-octulosonic-acid transferase